jgi:hypothetical protein
VSKEEFIRILEGVDVHLIKDMYPGIFDCHPAIEVLWYITTSKEIAKYYKALKIKKYFNLTSAEKYKRYREKRGNVSNTLEYFLVFYPEDVAKEQFRLQSKKRPNVYDPVYIAKRENITLEQAEKFVKKYKSDKATSKKNFIKKYGKDLGITKWESFAERTLGVGYNKKLWCDKFGTNEQEWVQRNKKKNPRCVEYWMFKHDMTLEEANLASSQYQRNNSGVHLEYYLNKGYNEAEAISILKEMSKKKESSSVESIKRKNPHLCIEEILDIYDKRCKSKIRPRTIEILAKTRKTLEEKGVWVPLELLTEYEIYKRKVLSITNKQKIKTLEFWDKRGKTGVKGAYHLDHKFSVRQGFLSGVSEEIIGHIKNLEFITWEENVRKQSKCSITLETLIKEIYLNEN